MECRESNFDHVYFDLLSRETHAKHSIETIWFISVALPNRWLLLVVLLLVMPIFQSSTFNSVILRLGMWVPLGFLSEPTAPTSGKQSTELNPLTSRITSKNKDQFWEGTKTWRSKAGPLYFGNSQTCSFYVACQTKFLLINYPLQSLEYETYSCVKVIRTTKVVFCWKPKES